MRFVQIEQPNDGNITKGMKSKKLKQKHKAPKFIQRNHSKQSPRNILYWLNTMTIAIIRYNRCWMMSTLYSRWLMLSVHHLDQRPNAITLSMLIVNNCKEIVVKRSVQASWCFFLSLFFPRICDEYKRLKIT